MLKCKKLSQCLDVEKQINEAICRTCDYIIDVGNKGRTALVQHIRTASHLSKSRASDGSQKQKNTDLQARVSAAEATLVYHTVKHGLSFKTSDCTSKLCNKLFSDSKIGKKKLSIAPARKPRPLLSKF
jgi:hypothetical protein